MTLIRERRKAMRLSIFDVALGTKVREAHVSAIENRKIVAFPRQRKVLANFYKVEESELFESSGFAREAAIQ